MNEQYSEVASNKSPIYIALKKDSHLYNTLNILQAIVRKGR